ncbi:carbamoyltransferase HypF [Pontibacillus yanchengensis]|uniref:Carbamoyltransferase n=2 Tax=Pontibacillus yanchengensis TaxID=462910 RepID=A0A6I5A637_9BACI|nr:carbamoyltransferase HypF [Pontibacillus yanchengensis]MYL35830.1 carbamoyltransferase HypF [Pontibacillus yanchengensis]
MYKAINITVNGRVQGVGFRPYVYSLSQKYRLAGTVQNNLGYVKIHAEGEEDELFQMYEELKNSPPPLSKIDEVVLNEVAPLHYEEFIILPSEREGGSFPCLPTDAAICKDCLEELNNPQDRRYHYPFINCTQCGPRYTIIEKLPYDRPHTKMRGFTMCSECETEYHNPLSRRHHAQPNCCPKCGPTVTLLNRLNEKVAEKQDAIIQAREMLKEGFIVGVKGLGGYHLACNAYREDVVEQLRLRKKRPQRPLAVMVKSIDVAQKLCHISNQEERLLRSSEMPIVVLQVKEEERVAKNVSSGLSTLGVMLPYTPLHHLLFDDNQLECLVMTSSNVSGLPIQYEDPFSPVLQLCDYVLTHNREIYLPIDDSVVQCEQKKITYLRRARGYAPDPIKTKAQIDQIIALGGNQKNTFAVGKNNHIVLSPHIGDLENEEMIHYFKRQLTYFKKWLDVQERYIAIDKHPFYATRSIAKELDGEVISVQHHHAHHVSCMEDNELQEPTLGIVLDGTGYGNDGHIWGFELLYGNAAAFERLGHLQYTPLPGGEKAVKEPWRNAVGMLLHHWPQEGKRISQKLFPDKTREIEMITSMVENRVNVPMAGTCGRLFDAVSAILGICLTSTYEGEAAITLSDYINQNTLDISKSIYPYHIHPTNNGTLQLDPSPMLYNIIQDKWNQVPIRKIVRTFHDTIAQSCVQMIHSIVENRPEINKNIVLSGGAFQNVYLTQKLQSYLTEKGFNVYTHKKIPCNDGGLSFGQMIIASHEVQSNNKSEGGASFCV